MRLEGATLALDPRSERDQGWRILPYTLAQDIHVFIFVHHFQVTPPGTPCDCFPLPLHPGFYKSLQTIYVSIL
jgi:hypothetical protein